MAVGIPADWHHRFRMARPVAEILPPAGRAQGTERGGVRIHPQRSAGTVGSRSVEEIIPLEANLGVRGGQVPDRSDLVVLPVLASEISGDARAVAQNGGPAAGDDLPGGRH